MNAFDGQTDAFLAARQPCIQCSAVTNEAFLFCFWLPYSLCCIIYRKSICRRHWQMHFAQTMPRKRQTVGHLHKDALKRLVHAVNNQLNVKIKVCSVLTKVKCANVLTSAIIATDWRDVITVIYLDLLRNECSHIQHIQCTNTLTNYAKKHTHMIK